MVRRTGRIRVDAREAGPGPVSRLRGAHASGRDGVRELRGLCHRRSRRPAQPSLRARPRKSPEAVRGRLPPHETTTGPESEWHLGKGRGRPPIHLHELRRLRRRGRHEMPRCAAEFEAEPEPLGVEEDILDLVLCPTCGADNDPELEECEICGTALRGRKEPSPVATEASLPIPPATRPRPVSRVLDKLDEFLRDLRPLVSEVPRPDGPRRAIAARPPEAKAKTPVSIPQPAPASSTKKLESAPAPSAPVPITSKPASPMPKQQPVDQTRPAPATEIEARLAPRDKPSIPSSVKIRGRAEAPSRIPRKNARPAVGEARTRITAETAGGLVLAASTSLLLAGA